MAGSTEISEHGSFRNTCRLMYAQASMEFIDNWFPLIVTVREGSFDEAEMEQMATGWERYFRRAEPYAVLNAARLGANAPDARGRLRIAQWGNLPRVRQFSKLLCAGTATVMTFPWERRAATALSWLWTPPSPCRSVSSVDEGLAYCLESLAQRGVDLPREPETFRIDVQRMLRGLSIAGLPPRRDSRPFGWISRPSARTESLWHPSRTEGLQRASTSQAALHRLRANLRNSRST